MKLEDVEAFRCAASIMIALSAILLLFRLYGFPLLPLDFEALVFHTPTIILLIICMKLSRCGGLR